MLLALAAARCAAGKLAEGVAIEAGDLGQALAHQDLEVGAGDALDQRSRQGRQVSLALQ
ncbi:hypothetical protein FQZ97_1241920 [compost metagenome]